MEFLCNWRAEQEKKGTCWYCPIGSDRLHCRVYIVIIGARKCNNDNDHCSWFVDVCLQAACLKLFRTSHLIHHGPISFHLLSISLVELVELSSPHYSLPQCKVYSCRQKKSVKHMKVENSMDNWIIHSQLAYAATKQQGDTKRFYQCKRMDNMFFFFKRKPCERTTNGPVQI